MNKDNVGKMIGKLHSAFDTLSINILICLFFVAIFFAILRFIEPFSETTKAFVIFAIPLSVLFLALVAFKKGGKARQFVIDITIIFVGYMVLMRALKYIMKNFRF